MRWRPDTAQHVCATCGGRLHREDVWCGSCGAATGDGPRTVEEVADPLAADAPAGPGADGGSSTGPVRSGQTRRVLGIVAVLAAVVVAVGLLRPSPPPRVLLGDVGSLAGLTATSPPPAALRVAWETPLLGVATGRVMERAALVVGDDRVRVGDLVVDRDNGRVLRRATLPLGPDGAVVQAGELIVLDTLTGRVATRVELPGGLGEDAVVRARSGTVTLVVGDGLALLVDDSGATVASRAGEVSDNDRMVQTPAAFVVRDAATGAVVLLDAVTGEVGAEVPVGPEEMAAVDVVGDLVMVATSTGRLPGPTTGVPWDVTFLEAGTGAVVRRTVTQSAEAPRMLGTLRDGPTVFTSRSGNEVTVRGFTPGGVAGPLAQLTTGVRGAADSPRVVDSAALATAGVTDRLAVGIDVRRGLVAIGRSRNVVWQVDVEPPARLVAGADLVAVVPAAVGRGVRILEADEGRAVFTIPADDIGDPRGPRPVAVLDEVVAVGVGESFGAPRTPLDATSWYDLATGDEVVQDDLLSTYAGADGTVADESWVLVGTLRDGASTVPVSTQTRRGVVRVLRPGEPTRSFAPPPDPAGEAVARAVLEPVGATRDLMAVWRVGLDDAATPTTFLLDRGSGEVREVPGVVGVALVGDLLLAVELEPDDRSPRPVGIDIATGERQWSDPPGLLTGAAAVHRLDDDLLVLAGALGLQGIALEDGTLRWTHMADTELTGSVVLGAAHVVVATTTGEVVALDRGDGTEAWRADVGAPVTAMVGAGEHVLLGTHDGLVVHLDADGDELQRAAVGTGRVTAVAVAGETLLAVVDGRMVGLRADGVGVTERDQVPLPERSSEG